MNETSNSRSPRIGRNVVLVDPSVLGQSHLLVNLGMVKLCAALFDSVEVIAEQSHCDALVEYGARCAGQVTFRSYKSSKELSSQLLRELDSTSPIIFLNLEYGLFVRVMTSRLRRDRPVYWALHSHFASPPSSLRSRAKFLLRKNLLFRAFPESKFIVYGERIRQNLLDALGGSVDGSRVLPVLHPLGVDRLPDRHAGHDPGQVRISFVRGWHAPPPATEAVVAALAAMSESQHSLTFSVVSNVVLVRADGSRVISSDYLERLDRLVRSDLALYLPTNGYTLQASGALMDSFVSGCPLIGLQTDFQREIESVVGPVGFFFDSAEDLLGFIPSLSEPTVRAEIELRQQNLARGYATVMEVAARQLRSAVADQAAYVSS